MIQSRLLFLFAASLILSVAANAETPIVQQFVPAPPPVAATSSTVTIAPPGNDPYNTLAGVAKDYKPGSGAGSTADRLEGFQPQQGSTALGQTAYQDPNTQYNTATFLESYNPNSTSAADGPMKDYQQGAGSPYYR